MNLVITSAAGIPIYMDSTIRDSKTNKAVFNLDPDLTVLLFMRVPASPLHC
jgi:hypothetical protein